MAPTRTPDPNLGVICCLACVPFPLLSSVGKGSVLVSLCELGWGGICVFLGIQEVWELLFSREKRKIIIITMTVAAVEQIYPKHRNKVKVTLCLFNVILSTILSASLGHLILQATHLCLTWLLLLIKVEEVTSIL